MKDSDLVVTTTEIESLIEPTTAPKRQMILALTDRIPEITDEDAMNGGAAFYSDGRRVNTLLICPGVFKRRRTEINNEMSFAVAEALSEGTPSGAIVPNPWDANVHLDVARATALAAMETRVAHTHLDEEYFN